MFEFFFFINKVLSFVMVGKKEVIKNKLYICDV